MQAECVQQLLSDLDKRPVFVSLKCYTRTNECQISLADWLRHVFLCSLVGWKPGCKIRVYVDINRYLVCCTFAQLNLMLKSCMHLTISDIFKCFCHTVHANVLGKASILIIKTRNTAFNSNGHCLQTISPKTQDKHVIDMNSAFYLFTQMAACYLLNPCFCDLRMCTWKCQGNNAMGFFWHIKQLLQVMEWKEKSFEI